MSNLSDKFEKFTKNVSQIYQNKFKKFIKHARQIYQIGLTNLSSKFDKLEKNYQIKVWQILKKYQIL